ncbi:MAG: acyl-CoA dehydrogenase family protein, partial [Defluviicoccus sp.]|nr:acyl-CoA dehydrogenase family protein [Defluviicoccus sp.]
MLRDSARRFLADTGGAERVRRLRGTEHGFDREVLRAMAQQGWLGVLVSADRGGLGLGLTEAALLLEQAGRALAPEPAGASIVAAASLAACEVADALLARVFAGEALVVPAVATEGGGVPPPPAAGPRRGRGGGGPRRAPPPRGG